MRLSSISSSFVANPEPIKANSLSVRSFYPTTKWPWSTVKAIYCQVLYNYSEGEYERQLNCSSWRAHTEQHILLCYNKNCFRPNSTTDISTLSPTNWVSLQPICINNYFVLRSVIAAWIMFCWWQSEWNTTVFVVNMGVLGVDGGVQHPGLWHQSPGFRVSKQKHFG